MVSRAFVTHVPPGYAADLVALDEAFSALSAVNKSPPAPLAERICKTPYRFSPRFPHTPREVDYPGEDSASDCAVRLTRLDDGAYRARGAYKFSNYSALSATLFVNTKTQRHKGTKKAGEQRSIDAGFLCAFVSLCLCVYEQRCGKS